MGNMEPCAVVGHHLACHSAEHGILKVVCSFLFDCNMLGQACFRQFLVIIHNGKRWRERQLERGAGGETVKGDEPLLRCQFWREEGNPYAVAIHHGISAIEFLAHINRRSRTRGMQRVDDIVHKAWTEDMEVEEVRQVHAAIEREAVAQLPAVEVLEGGMVEKRPQRGVEERVTHVAAQRMPHRGSLVINC